MKVVMATPNFHQQRGNTVTVQRISDGLEDSGIQTEIVSITDDTTISSFPEADVIHGFNAFRFYIFKEKLGSNQTPFVITMTGTDLNHDLFNEERRETVLTCLKEASAITVFDEAAKRTLIKEKYGIESKVFVIRQGTSNLKATETSVKKEKGSFLFVLPAGIRKVKNIPFAIHTLRKLYVEYPHVRLLLVGPIIEEDEGKAVKELAAENSDWVSYIGQLPHTEMAAAYENADVVLNTSHSEGQPAAILEAMEFGVPVIASDNSGNRNIVSHGITGFVYNKESEFLEYAKALLNNNEIRVRFGSEARSYILKHHSREYETHTLMKIYQEVLDENK